MSPEEIIERTHRAMLELNRRIEVCDRATPPPWKRNPRKYSQNQEVESDALVWSPFAEAERPAVDLLVWRSNRYATEVTGHNADFIVESRNYRLQELKAINVVLELAYVEMNDALAGNGRCFWAEEMATATAGQLFIQ